MESQDDFLSGENPGGPLSPDRESAMDTTERDSENEGIRSPSGVSEDESGELSSEEDNPGPEGPICMEPTGNVDEREIEHPASPKSLDGDDNSSPGDGDYKSKQLRSDEASGYQSPEGDAPGSPDPDSPDSEGYYESETGEVHSPSGLVQSPMEKRGPQTPEIYPPVSPSSQEQNSGEYQKGRENIIFVVINFRYLPVKK